MCFTGDASNICMQYIYMPAAYMLMYIYRHVYIIRQNPNTSLIHRPHDATGCSMFDESPLKVTDKKCVNYCS